MGWGSALAWLVVVHETSAALIASANPSRISRRMNSFFLSHRGMALVKLRSVAKYVSRRRSNLVSGLS